MSQAISNAHMEEDEVKEVPVTVRPAAAAASAAGAAVVPLEEDEESEAEEVEDGEIDEKAEALEAKVASEVVEEIALILAHDTKYLEEEKTLNDTGKCLITGKYMYFKWKHWIQKERITVRLEKHGFKVLEIYVGHDIGDSVNNYHHTHALVYVEWDAEHGGSTKQVRYNPVGFMDFLPPWLDCTMELDEKGKPKSYHPYLHKRVGYTDLDWYRMASVCY